MENIVVKIAEIRETVFGITVNLFAFDTEHFANLNNRMKTNCLYFCFVAQTSLLITQSQNILQVISRIVYADT